MKEFTEAEKIELVLRDTEPYRQIVAKHSPEGELPTVGTRMLGDERCVTEIESTNHKMVIGWNWIDLRKCYPEEEVENSSFSEEEMVCWFLGFTYTEDKLTGKSQTIGTRFD